MGTSVPADVREQASKADVAPTSELKDDGTAVVKYVTFAKWGGLIRVAHSYSRQLPHSLVAQNSETVVKYDCGIRF